MSVDFARSSTSPFMIKWSDLILRIDLRRRCWMVLRSLMRWRYRVQVSLPYIISGMMHWLYRQDKTRQDKTTLLLHFTHMLWVSSLLSDLYSQKPCPWASPSHITQPESVLLSLHLACSPWWHSYRDIWSGLLSSIFTHQWRNPAVHRHSRFLFSWCWSWNHFQWQVAVWG